MASMLSYKVKAVPDQAKEEILDALIRADGDLEFGAEILGVSLRTLYRYIQELRMYPEIDAAYEARGISPLHGGPKRKYT